MPPTISTRLRAWRAVQCCPHCAGTGKRHEALGDAYVQRCWYCRGTGNGLSQEQAAKLAGVPRATWRNWEHSRRTPTASSLALIERVLAGATVVPVVNPQGESEQP